MELAYKPELWHDVFVVIGTSAGTLVGLLFIVMSLHIERIRERADDKVLAAWNGLTLGALARGYEVLREPRYLEAATGLARFLHQELWKDGTLLRTWRRGHAHTPGFLEDYGAVAAGLVDLFEAGFDPQWLRDSGIDIAPYRARLERFLESGTFDRPAELCSGASLSP